MMIFDEGIKGSLAGTITNSEDRKFASEGNKFFEDERAVGKFRADFFHVFVGAEKPLALAVVAEATGFEHGGKADLLEGSVQVVSLGDFGEIRGGNA